MSLPSKLIIIISNIDILRLVMKFSGHSSMRTLMNTSNWTRDAKKELLCWPLNNKYSIKYLLNESFRKKMNCLVSNIKHQILIRADSNDLRKRIRDTFMYNKWRHQEYKENKVLKDYLKHHNLEYILLNVLKCFFPIKMELQKNVDLLSVQGMSSTTAYGCPNCSEQKGYYAFCYIKVIT